MSEAKSSTTKGRPPQNAVELISPPLRLAILITLLITAGGIAWACLARIPIYVNGIAYLQGQGTIDGIPATTDGVVHYQFSSRELISKPLFRRIERLSQDIDTVESAEIAALARSVLATPASGPSVAINTPYPRQIPKGQLLAWIDSPAERTALQSKLLEYYQAKRALARQQAELGRLNSKINVKMAILRRQLASESAYLANIEELLNQGYASKVNVLSQQSRVDTIQAELLTQQQELAANSERLLEAQAQQQQASDNLRIALNTFVERSFVFAGNPLYLVDLNAPQASPVKQQYTLLHTSSLKPSQLPDQIPGYLSQSDAEQVASGMQVLVTPMGMDRAQFGGIMGQVIDVSPLPATVDQIAERSGSQAEAQTLTSLIPEPVRVDLKLQRDPKDREPRHGGYRWSSPGTPPFAITAGTLQTLQITAQRVRPISLLIPSLMRLTGASPPVISPQRLRSNRNPGGGTP